MIALALMLAQASAANPYARYARPKYEEPTAPFTLAGVGQKSCATAFQPEYDITMRGWILGFWSGLNAGRGGTVGDRSDAAGLIAEVKLVCDAHPSDPLAQAALTAYKTLANR